MRPSVILLSILAASITTHAMANGRGNGGIDVKTKEGKLVPIEAYIANHSRPIPNICDVQEIEKGVGDAREWKADLNRIVNTLYQKLPAAGELLLKALGETEFYFLDLRDGDSLVFTDDDGHLIETTKENGAVRIPDRREVFILTDSWRNYWNNAEKGFEYQAMLVRVLHEALLPYYKEEKVGKFSLGKTVVEILRMADIFPKNQGHPKSTLFDKDAKTVAWLLNQNGLAPTGIDGVQPDFSIKINLISGNSFRQGHRTDYNSDISENWREIDADYQSYVARAKAAGIPDYYYSQIRIGYRLHPSITTFNLTDSPSNAFFESEGSLYLKYTAENSTSARVNEEIYQYKLAPELSFWRQRIANPPRACND